MKKLLTFSLLFILTQIFSQTYHFDYYLDYKREIKRDGETNKSDKQFLVNSKIHEYEMIFETKNSKTAAMILDFDNDVSHFFEVKNTGFPLKNQDFEYQYSVNRRSTKKQFEDEYNRRFFSSELIGQKDGMYQYSINGYNNEKLKKPNSKAVVNFVKFDTDLSSFALSSLVDYKEINRKLKFKDNYIVKNATNKFEDAEVKLTLEAVEPQNLNFTLDPSKIKFSE